MFEHYLTDRFGRHARTAHTSVSSMTSVTERGLEAALTTLVRETETRRARPQVRDGK